MKYVYTFYSAGTNSTYTFLFRFSPKLNVLKALFCIALVGGTFSAATAQISGTVFRDFNGNGTKETTEPLTPGVIIRAYNTSGVLCGSAVSSGTAVTNYTLAGCGTGDVRVEFEIPATGNCVNLVLDNPSPGGAMYGSSVQFVKGNAANVNFGILNPDHYNAGAANTMAYVPCYVHGDPLSTTTTSGDDPWFVGFPYNNSGTTVPSKKLNGRIIGPTWGVAYSKQARKIFTSALVKRHVGLGQLGTGGIYMLTETPSSFSVTSFYDLDANGHRTRADGTTAPAYGSGTSFSFVQPGTTKNSVVYLGATDPLTGQPAGLGVMGTNSQRGLSVSPSTPTYDPAAFDQVGKVGLGDLEISDDGVFLFVVNLYSRKLLRMRFDNPENPVTFTEILEYNLPAISVTNGILRPWALKFYKNKLYVGAVSSGENAGTISDLNAYVFEVTNPTGTLTFNNTPVLTYPLNFTRGGATGATCTTWNPWTNNTNSRTRATNSCYPQPILADLEFTDRDDLLLSFIDRAGNQWGDRNYEDLAGPTTQTFFTIAGDIQVAGYNCSTNAYTLENDGRYTSINGETLTGNTTNNQGPGGGEFFFNDSYGGLHFETAKGSMAVLKGEGKVMLTIMDPLGIVSGGTAKFSTTNGADSDRYQLYSGGLGKAVGLGDLELSAAFAPVEIGNRVWVDVNQNGIQDAGEAGIPGAEVRLYDAAKTTLLATAVTDANGSYYFTGNTSATGTSGSYVSTTALQPNTEYTLVVVSTGNTGLSVTAITPLTPGETGSVNSGTTTINNDAKTDNVGGQQLPCIRLTTGAPGTVSHTYDFGFQCIPQPALVATTSQNVCQGSTLILSVDGRPGMTYEWFLSSSTAVVSTAVALTTAAINSTTTYRVRGSLLGCTTNESPVVLTPVACQTCTVSPATIGGTVFRDFNSDGIDAANDPGIAGVSVTIFRCDSDGSSIEVATTTTDLNGNYSFTGLTSGTTYRVEFTNLPAGFNPTYRGTNNGTTAQFVLPGTCNASLGLNQAADFCQNNPPLITPCHVNGGNTAVTPNDALVRFNYDKTGKASIATTGQIGTTWGAAYARTTRKVYTAAFLKRHSAMGPAGPGAIYITDLTSGTTTTFFNLTTIESVGNVPGNITRGLGTTANPGSPNTDPQAFSLVGTVSLGDIDISEDDQFLYTINLASKKLYRLPVTNPSAGNIVNWDIPAPGCIGGQWRPFALKVAGSKLYVGGICDASTTPVNFTSVASLDAARANLRAVVYEFDPVSGNFTEKLNFPLNFDRGNASALLCTSPALYEKATHWNPWIDWHKQNGTAVFADCGINDSYPQPLLSDIETDVDGSLILAFMDRWGHQTGESNNYPDGTFGETGTAAGDIMRADFNGGNFLLENNGIAGQRVVGGTTAQQTYNSSDNTAPNGQGRGGREFYFGDTWMNTHDERSMGSVALLRGSGDVVMTAMDASNAIYTGGVIWLNNTTGLADDDFTVYSGGIASFGKAYGLGDIEVGCNIAPVQIGNRVFRDDNRNGVQDPCEPPVPGAVVRLYDAAKTTILASVTTNSAGEYYFQSGTVVAGTSTSAVTTTALTYNTAYALVIASLGTSTVVTSQGLNLTDVSPLTPGESGTLNTGTTVRNNDAKSDLIGGISLPCIRLTTGGPGENNHTYDFGLAKYVCVPPAVTALAGSSTLCEGNVVSLSVIASPAGSYTYAWAGDLSLTIINANTASPTTSSLSSGVKTFTVTVTSGNACSATAQVSVTVAAVPVIEAGPATTVCAGSPATLMVTCNIGTPVWSTNETTQSIVVQPTATTTYTVFCRSASGCNSPVASITVTVIPLPVAGIVSTSAATCAGNNQVNSDARIQLTGVQNADRVFAVSSGPIPSYTAAGGQPVSNSAVTFSGLGNPASPSGQSYTLVLYNGPSCYTTTTVMIPFQNCVCSTTLVLGTPVCNSVTNQYTLTGQLLYVNVQNGPPSGADNGVPFTLNQGVQGVLNFTLTGVSDGGSHTVTAGFPGCINSTAFYTAPAACTLCSLNVMAQSGSGTSICQGQPVSLIAIVSPAGSYTYSWATPAGTLTGTNSATASVTNLPVGTHTFTVTVSSSPVCSTTATVSVTVNPVPAPTVSNMTVCAGQSAVLTVQNCAGIVQWSANANSAAGTSVTVSPMSTATYSVSCTVNGCTGSAMATVTVNGQPVINSMSAGVCTGLVASVSVNASTASGNLEYSFNGGTFTPADTFTLTVPTPTTVTVVVRTTGTSCTVSQSLPVNCACQTPATVSLLPASPQTCGLTPVSLTADVTGAASATLTGTGTGTFSQTVISGNTAVFYTPSIADVSAGSITITVTSADPDGAGACVSVSQRQILTVTTPPKPVLSAVPATVCAGSSQTLNANCQTGTVRWSTGETTASITVFVMNTASYTAVCQSGTACQSSPAGITVNAAPNPSATASQTVLTCVQGQVPDNTTLIAQTNSTAQTGQWTAKAGNPNTTTFTNALSLTTTVSGLLPGRSYTFVWTNTGGCTAEVIVTAGSCTPLPASLGDYVFADVNRNGVQDSGDMPIEGAIVTLLQNNSAVATTSTNSAGIYSFSGLTPGIPYSVSFSTPPGFTGSTTANVGPDNALDSDPVNGVTAPVTLTAGENNLTLDAGFVVTPGVLMVNSPTVCAGNNATLTVAGCSGTVSWNTGAQGASLTIATTGIVSATVLSYTATCTTANTTTFVAGTVTVVPVPVVSVTATRSAGTGSVTLTANGCSGGTLTWSTGSTGQQIYVTPSATTLYSVSCVTGPGCSASARIRIGSIPANLDVSVTSALICAGQQITLSATNCGADLVWSTGATGSSISVNPAITTVYSVTCSDEVNTAAASTTITVVPAPAVTLTAGSTIVTAGQSVTLTATGCQSGTLNWSTGAVGAVSQVVSPSMTTTYSVTCVTGPQCSTTAGVSVLVSGPPVLLLNKLVSRQRAQLGEVVSYTLLVSNTGDSAAGNVIIQDSLSSAVILLPASVTASAGTFATGSPNTWTLTSFPAGATATLTYSASIVGEGVVYNTARILSVPNSETTVCLSVPVKFCTSEVISLQLNAPTGYTGYQWLRNGEVIASATGSSYTATQVGEYNVLVNQGQCPNGSCCPVIIELDSVPAFTVMPQTPGCEAGQPRNDGRLTVQGLGQNLSLYRYAIAEGTSFTVANPVPMTVPSNGILAANLIGDRDYTVRVYNAQGCYRDVTVRLVTNCQCPADICVPVVIKKTKSRTAVR